MKIQLEVKINPFDIPAYVTIKAEPRSRQEGFSSEDGIPLSALDSETLEKLCNDFRDGVFRKAGKNQPATAVEGIDRDYNFL